MPQNVPLGKSVMVLVNSMRLSRMRSHWSRVGPCSNVMGVLRRRGKETQGTDIRWENAMGKTGRNGAAGQGVPRVAGKASDTRKRQGRILPKGFRGSMARLTPWFWTSSLQNYETINFCCFHPPSLWHLVRAALGTIRAQKRRNWGGAESFLKASKAKENSQTCF